MAKYYIFGSVARKIKAGDDYDGPAPSDVDVIMIPGNDQAILRLLRCYAVENDGPLDLFFFAGDQLTAAFDEHDERRILLTKHTKAAIAEDLYEVSLSGLLRRLETFNA
jgi:hypothetical protein